MKSQNSFSTLKNHKTSKTKNDLFNKYIRIKPNANVKFHDKKQLMINKTSTSISVLNKNKSSTLSMTKPTCSLKETMSKLYSKMRFELHKYNQSTKKINIKIINDIIYDENKRIVSIFKDYLLWDEFSDFFKKCYNLNYSYAMLPKIGRYYEIYTKFFPEYGPLEDLLYILAKYIKKQKKYLQMLEENEDKVEIEKNNEFKRLINDSEISLSNTKFFSDEMKKNLKVSNPNDMNNSTLKLESMEKDFGLSKNDYSNINSTNDKNISKDLFSIIQNCMNNDEKKQLNRKLKTVKKHIKNNLTNLTELAKYKIKKNSRIAQSQNFNFNIIEMSNKKSQGVSLKKLIKNRNVNEKTKKNIIGEKSNSNFINNRSSRQTSCNEKHHNLFSQSINNIDIIKKNSKCYKAIKISRRSEDKNSSPYNIKKLLYNNSEYNSRLTKGKILNNLPVIKYETFKLNSYNNSRKRFAKNIINLKKDKIHFSDNIKKGTSSKIKTSSINKKNGNYKQRSCVLNLYSKKRNILDEMSTKSKVIELDSDCLFINKIIEPYKNNSISKISNHKNESKKVSALKFNKSNFKTINQASPIINNIKFSPTHNLINNNLARNHTNLINPFRRKKILSPRKDADQSSSNNMNYKNLLTKKRKLVITSLLIKKSLATKKGEIENTSNSNTNTNTNTNITKEKTSSKTNIKNNSLKKKVNITDLNKRCSLSKQINKYASNKSKNLYSETQKKSKIDFTQMQRVKNSILINEIQNHKKDDNYLDRNKKTNEIIKDKNIHNLTSERKNSKDKSKNETSKETNPNKIGYNRSIICSNNVKNTIKTQRELKNIKELVVNTDKYENKKNRFLSNYK